METRLKETVHLFLFVLVCGQTIRLGSCAFAGSSGDTFSIRHNGTENCLVAGNSGVALGPCDGPDGSQWKWGSGHRLFHRGSAQCLGLEVGTGALALLKCDSIMLRWRCHGGAVLSAFQMGLTVSEGVISTKKDAPDVWTRGSSQDNICQKPYRVVHTTDGNSAGAPCEFPFVHNGTWHHQCVPEESSERTWCSTTMDHDADRRKGYCLLPEEGCGMLFEGPVGEGGPCYQFVVNAAVTWQEALDSCRSQGADLLSLSSAEAAGFPIPDGGHNRMPERMWVGLHQLDTAQGWQWSDGAPLAYLRWEQEMPPFSALRESDCGVMNAKHNYETEACDMRLPYICKKTVNASQPEPTESVGDTVCEEGWAALSGWCYRLVKDKPTNFTAAQGSCKAIGGELASLHSLETLEMIHTRFHSGGTLDVWIALMGMGYPGAFLWLDQSPVNFTYWARGQPLQPSNTAGYCVFYSGPSHGWTVGDCDRSLPFLCQKRGSVTESANQTGCSEGWRKHGDSCYRVDVKQVSFEERCDITIRNRFEQAFVNRLLTEQLHGDVQYFWTGLRDVNTTGEYRWTAKDGTGSDVVYSNWGSFEPALAGGCAVMSTEKPVGRWEVKSCTLFQAGSVCKKDLTAPPPPEPQPDPSLPCPKGWASRDGIPYCYKVFHGERLSRKRTWEEAERFCEELGAHLPSFQHPEEMRALHYVMRDFISDDRFFWVGLNRRNPADRSWEWSDGRPVSMGIMEQDFHEDDDYNRDCAGFKTMKGTTSLFVFLLGFPPKPFYATPFHCDAKLEWVCQLPRGVTPKNPAWYNPDGHHDTSIFVDGKEYWFVTEPRLSYQEASEFCSSSGNGSKLAAPHSFTAARQINVNLPKTTDAKQSWWANVREPGHFIPMTVNDKRWLHTIFLGTCTSIAPQSLWPERDHVCETRLPFVCERHNVTSVERNPWEPHPLGQPCGKDQASFRDKCYTVIAPVEKTFKGANELCQSLRGTLLSISDQAEQDFVTTLLPNQPKKTWIGLKMSHAEPEWVDNVEVSFLNFNPLLHGLLRPMVINALDPDSRELCVFVTNDPHSAMMGSWDFTTCSDQLNVTICQHYADKPEEPRVSLERFRVNNHTFMLIRQNVSWFGALEVCRDHKMDLASVSDTLQQSALTVRVSRARTPMWLGLFSEDEGVHYRWMDHSHTVFSRWSPEPTSGACVYLDTEGFWRGTECEDILEGAICHEPHEETITTPDEIAVKCPHKSGGPNWIPFGNNCYTFQLESFRWDEFNKGNVHDTCRKLDASADVLTIRNAQENEFVRKELLPFSNLVQFVWLGVFKEEDAGDQMKWYDGTNVQYSNWDEGRPDVQGEFMAGLNDQGQWEFYTNKRLFELFKQRTIVACKLDKDPKEEYNQSMKAYERYGNLSYTVLTRKLSWFQALAECGQRGGHLASVHDIQHDAHIELIASRDGFPLWIGLSSQDAEGIIYEWSDGTRYDYKGLVSPPREGAAASTPRGGCVYVTTTGEWVLKDCNAMADGAICYTTTVTTPSQRANKLQAPQSTNHCPQSGGASRWVQFRDQCYAFDMSFFNHSVYSMEDAKDICHGLDAQLLTIKTKEENDFVRDYVEENPLITSRVWLGMDLDTAGKPVGWVDGTAVGFSNFEQTQSKPGLAAGLSAPSCVVLVSADKGLWNLVSCKDSHSRIVCKVAARSGGVPVALGFFIIILLALLSAIGFVIYKKNRSRFFSTVRYKRNFDEADTTSIITDAE